jgi:hypothetical protein
MALNVPLSVCHARPKEVKIPQQEYWLRRPLGDWVPKSVLMQNPRLKGKLHEGCWSDAAPSLLR